jgi:hypothetical protein
LSPYTHKEYVSSISRLGPSSRCVTAADSIYEFLDVFNKQFVSLEDAFSYFSPT